MVPLDDVVEMFGCAGLGLATNLIFGRIARLWEERQGRQVIQKTVNRETACPFLIYQAA
jgi:hypothetical protein